MSYSYNKNYPANAGKTNYGLNSFAAYLAKEDEKKKKETPPYKPESQKKTLTPFEKMADISKNIAGGARIKQNVEDALTKNYPSGNYKGIFDGIDEKKIENNISLADDVIKKNTAGGAYKITPRENLPWLRDGLALFYASAEQGDSKAANAARTAAYTEEKQPEAKSSDDIPDFFGNALKRFEDDNSKTTNQTFFTSPKRTKADSGQYDVAENEKGKSETEKQQDYNHEKKLPADSLLRSDQVIDAYMDFYESTKDLLSSRGNASNPFHSIITMVSDYFRALPLQGNFPRTLKPMAKAIWKGGSKLYLREGKGYYFSADLLEHSLKEKPSDLVFYDDSYAADIIKKDQSFLKKIDEIVEKIENNISLTNDDKEHKFEAGDLLYAIHGCRVEIIDISHNNDNTRNVSIHISDEYDYTKIWTNMDGKGVSLATVANDAGVVSTWIDAINPYHVDIYLTIRR